MYIAPESGDSTRDRRNHGPTGRKIPKLEKDIAYQKDIGAFDFKDQTMFSILKDFVLDEVHKEISEKREAAGHRRPAV